MATENPRVWFKSISLENVRSFGTTQTINFTDKDGNAARWNVILGDNGTGKTTVLKGLVIAASEFHDNIASGPYYFHYYLRQETQLARIWVDYQDINGKVWGQHLVIGLHDGIFKKKNSVRQEQQDLISDALDSIMLSGYGANRRIDENSTLETGTDAATLFDENAHLIGPASWLMEAEYIGFKYKKLYDRYILIRTSLLRLFKNEISDIEIKVSESATPNVYFKTHYGNVRLHELSLGYRTLIAWMVDFAKGLFDRYPNSENPLAEPAVCLVDEIDLHLHPKFQRTIIQFLTETFPDTQFIVTAHSPLIVLAAEERPLDANIILLKREGDHTVVVNDPVDVSKWSVDQILNSDLFGYVPPASEPLTELRTERDSLLAKPKLDENEQVRLAELDEKIGFIPFGTNQDEIKAETIIQQLANALRSKQEAQ